MGANPVTTGGLRITACETVDELATAGGVFNQYRHHYGESPDDDGRTVNWLGDMVRSKLLSVYIASAGSRADAPAIGLATAHPVPASLVMGRFWQVRDLYVVADSRRRGVAAALISTVREAALASGARRLSLVTERDNGALGLYRRLGFRSNDELATLTLDLTR